ncbi:MAG: hypothetical protein NZM42_12910 [Gemmatales bacterium]|nr:hypothetical protein [Gemmatales bacterium]MDW8222370.1 hypothetical protein [Gemmatales bacterium]
MRLSMLRYAPVLISVYLIGCMEGKPAASADGPKEAGTVVDLDGLKSRAPADWKDIPTTQQFRYKVFRVPGDKPELDAELVIFYFGEGGGGGVEENIKRWKNMFQPPEGKSIDEVTKISEFKVGEVPVVYVDIQGTYLFRPFPAAPKAEPRKDHRMISVIFRSPKGPYFIRLVGPEVTVSKHQKAFDEWLKNFK